MSYFNKVVAQKFYKARLTLRKEALSAINEYLRKSEGGEVLSMIDELVTKIKECGPSSNLVDSAIVKTAIQKLHQGVRMELESKNQFIYVIDAMRTPKFEYDVVRKTFKLAKMSPSLHGNADAKRQMYVQRYRTVLQRLMHQKQFAPTESRFDKGRKYVKLTQIRSLLTQSSENESRVVFGMLSCIEEGKYFLEDVDSNVELDLSKAKIDTGLYTENCMVLVEGILNEDVFEVASMSFPLAETRKQSLLMYPTMRNFGLNLKTSERLRLEGLQTSGEMESHMVVVLSEIWLDKPEVLDYLRILLKGLSQSVPPLFVLMGNFTSKPLGLNAGDIEKLSGYFDELADLLLEFPELTSSSKFVFIPGPRDIGIGNVLPRPGLPSAITRKLRSNRFPEGCVAFPSNPCRVLYGTRELLFFRQDITHQMRRNCILPPSTHETKDMTNHLVKTLLEQAHLCPLPLPTRPVHWNSEHALTMYPLPDLFVLGDSVDHFNWSHYECNCANPASFALDQSFIVYYPASNKVQFSRVDVDALEGDMEEDGLSQG
ncbi:hypothetical protein AAMO2058_001105100 [Amorphochlora amoebiformis]